MKLLNHCGALIVCALALAGCASRQPAADASALAPATTTATKSAQAILAFETICLKTASSFAGAADAAKAFGITEFSDLGFARMGMTKDSNLGVQIKPGVECAITTPSQADPTLSSQFGAAIARVSGGRAPGRFPVAIVVGGQPFIFHHDRQGGEAFVMLSADSKRAEGRK